MLFEWDEAKRESNLAKHGLDFVDAIEVFEAEVVTFPDARQDYGEERWISLGMLKGYVVVVVWTDRDDDVMRIISMRRGNARERKAYEGI